MKKIIFLFLAVSGLMGCAQKAIQQDRVVQRFDTQAYFLDKQKNKSTQMNMDVVARRNQKMRIDAKVVLGLHLASLVMTPNQIEVAQHAEKKYYVGPPTAQVLRKTVGFPLHPLVFHAILYRQGLKGQGWSCEIKDGKVLKCLQASSGLQISWEDQKNATMVVAESKLFQLQWRISPPESVEEKANYFELKIPSSYEKLSL